MLHQRCDIGGGREDRAGDQRETVFLLNQVAVHRKGNREPGDLGQVGAEPGNPHVDENCRVREVSASSKLVAHLDVDEQSSADVAAPADPPEPRITSSSTLS